MRAAEVGDVIAMVRGAALPLLLRPAEAGRFEFRGFVYVPQLLLQDLDDFDGERVVRDVQTFELC